MLSDFAKDSFQGFKEAYKGQVNEEKWAKLRVNEPANRRAAQRKEVSQMKIFNCCLPILLQKVNRLLKAVLEYIDKHGCNPSALLCKQHMSDAASGPENDCNETREEWKTWMVGEKDIDLPEAITKLKFLEVIKPEWAVQNCFAAPRRCCETKCECEVQGCKHINRRPYISRTNSQSLPWVIILARCKWWELKFLHPTYLCKEGCTWGASVCVEKLSTPHWHAFHPSTQTAPEMIQLSFSVNVIME